MVNSSDIPLNFHFIEKRYLENINISYESFMNDYEGNGRVRSCYKANSNIININFNENR